MHEKKALLEWVSPLLVRLRTLKVWPAGKYGLYMTSSVELPRGLDSDVVQQGDKLAKNAKFWPEIVRFVSFRICLTVVGITWDSVAIACWEVWYVYDAWSRAA